MFISNSQLMATTLHSNAIVNTTLWEFIGSNDVYVWPYSVDIFGRYYIYFVLCTVLLNILSTANTELMFCLIAPLNITPQLGCMAAPVFISWLTTTAAEDRQHMIDGDHSRWGNWNWWQPFWRAAVNRKSRIISVVTRQQFVAGAHSRLSRWPGAWYRENRDDKCCLLGAARCG